MSIAPQGNFLLVIDASSYIHRAYHALPRTTRRADGLPTGALVGLCNSLLKLTRFGWTSIGRLPSHVAFVMDVRGKNFRHDFYPAYKAQRKPYDAELEAQLEWLPRVAEAFCLPVLAVKGFEADDTIATLATKAADEGLEVVIASSDKDLAQLVSGNTIMYDAMKDKGREDNAGALIGVSGVIDKFGVYPHQIVDYLSLVGDSVDNVPGVPKIGPKTAAKLLERFGDLDRMLEEAKWDESGFENPKDAARLIDYEGSILLSRELVTLRHDVPLEYEIDDLYLKAPAAHELRGFLMDLEFMHLANRVS